MIVVVIQPNLAPRDHLGMPRQSLHLGIGMIGSQSRFVRMDPKSRVHEGMLVSELNSSIERRRSVSISNRDHSPHSGLESASDNGLAIRIELLPVEMSVRIDEHGS